MKIVKLFLVIMILAGGYFFYINYQSQNNFIDAQAVFSTTIDTINPYEKLNFHNSRLNMVYESLIQTDNSLQFQPNLVTSFGQLDEKRWQLSIKQNIKFHDGSDLTPQLVIENFNQLKNHRNFKEILQNIKSIQSNPENANQIIFELNTPDPIFLQKLTLVPISSTTKDNDFANNPNQSFGTGPYKLQTYAPSLTKLELFDEYHSSKPFFQTLTLTAINNNFNRIQHGNNNQNVIIIENISPIYVDQLNIRKFQLRETTDLSTNFFLINQQSRTLNSVPKRQAALHIFPQLSLAEFTENLGVSTNQLLPRGVLGYNSQLPSISQTFEQAKKIIDSSGLRGSTLKIMLPDSTSKLEVYLKETLFEFGITADIQTFDYSQINLKQVATQFDLIFLGWKNEFGDGQQFFENVVLANSEYNLGRYNNSKVNQLINSAQKESNPVTRQDILRQVSQIIIEENPIAIPLFENKIYYAINKKFSYMDRLDGHINLTDFIIK